MLVKLLLIAAGGAVGSVGRYLVAGWVQHPAGTAFPVGTLVVNCIGCLAIGFLGTAFTGPILIREEHRLALTIGLLGGFTTFSAFAYETLRLAEGRQMALAAANVALSTCLGLLLAWVGARLSVRYLGV